MLQLLFLSFLLWGCPCCMVLAVNCSVLTSVMLHVALCHHMLTYLWSSTSYSSASLL